ncbi:8251_t:CDS:2, partial [Paraglomus occultum]
MVQKQPKKEVATNAPYFYPSFSRYNYPKFGTDDETYAEPAFKFPSWDDGLSGYTKRTYPRKNSHRYEDFDCDELHDDINSAKYDAQADYDRFKSHFSALSDELRALQQEIEETERRYLTRRWDADDESEAGSFSESSVLISGFGVGPSPKRSLTSSPTPQATSEVSVGGFGSSSRRILLSSPSAMQAATSPYRKRSTSIKSGYEEEEDDDCLSGPGSPNGRRCMGLDDGWTQERVHQNEWIR